LVNLALAFRVECGVTHSDGTLSMNTEKGARRVCEARPDPILALVRQTIMNISVTQAQGTVPVTVLSLDGDLDGANYQEVIAAAKDVYAAGARAIVIDMTNLRFMSSAGLVALHSIVLLLRGETPPDPEEGWSAFHAISHDRDSGLQRHVKLLNPQPRVDLVLDRTGMKAFFEIHNSLEGAIASF